MLVFNNTTIPVVDDLVAFDCELVKHMDIYYFYSDLLNLQDFSNEDLIASVEGWSDSVVQFIVKLINRAIAAATSLYNFLKKIVKRAIDRIKDFFNTKRKDSDSLNENERIATGKIHVLNKWYKRLDDYMGAVRSIDIDGINVRKSKGKSESFLEDTESLKSVDKDLDDITKEYIEKYDHSKRFIDSSVNFNVSSFGIVLDTILSLKKAKELYIKLGSSSRAKTNSSASHYESGVKHHSNIISDRYNTPAAYFYKSQSPKQVQDIITTIIKYCTAMQKAWGVWIKYCRDVMVLINKANGGTGEESVLLQFPVPQDVKKELGEYFGKFHDQAQKAPLKVNKVVVWSDNHQSAAAWRQSCVATIGLSVITHHDFDDFVRITLHELAHLSQFSRHYTTTSDSNTRVDKAGKPVKEQSMHNRYYVENPFSYKLLRSAHDSEFIEKQADKVAAQFVHDVKSGKISENCPTYKWLKDIKSRVEAYMKKRNIKHEVKYKDALDADKLYLRKRMESNRVTPLSLQKKKYKDS